MGNKFLLALLLISPIFAVGNFLISQELNMQNNYFKKFTSGVKQSNNGNRSRNLIYLSYISLIVLMILTSQELSSICGISFAMFFYIWWESKYESRQRVKYIGNIENQIAPIAEVFAILISAGMSPVSAFEWISIRASGELSERIEFIVERCKQGELLTKALDETNIELSSSVVRRFIDSIAIAVERGSSLSDQIRHFVSELRSHDHRKLLEKAGKTEVALMIPIVFLILPISVVFALWPSFQSLNTFLMH